jgi:hypothetical protein
MTSGKTTFIGRSLFTIFVGLASVGLKGITQGLGVVILDLLIGIAPSYFANLLGEILSNNGHLTQEKLKIIIRQSLETCLSKIAQEYNLDNATTKDIIKEIDRQYSLVLYQEINQINNNPQKQKFLEQEIKHLISNYSQQNYFNNLLTEEVLNPLIAKITVKNIDQNSLLVKLNQELSQQIYSAFIQEMPQQYINQINLELLNNLKIHLQNLSDTINSNLATIDQNINNLAHDQNIIYN